MLQVKLEKFLQITQEGHEIYSQYLAHGKTFSYAKKLFDNNLSKQALLNDIVSLNNPKLNSPCCSLLKHIESWQTQWQELKLSCSPSDRDRFVFISKIAYPKDAEALLLSFLSE